MTKITAQPRLNTERDYLKSFAKQTLQKDQGPWIMHDPKDSRRPEGVKRGMVMFYNGMVMFYNGEVPHCDDMQWAWGGVGGCSIAAYYPLEVQSDEVENPFLYWAGSDRIPSGLDETDTVEVIFRDEDRSIEPAGFFNWLHDKESWDIVAYRKIPKSPLRAGIWYGFSGNADGSIPSGLLPDTQVSVRLRGGYETSYNQAHTWYWSIDPSSESIGDIVAFMLKH